MTVVVAVAEKKNRSLKIQDIWYKRISIKLDATGSEVHGSMATFLRITGNQWTRWNDYPPEFVRGGLPEAAAWAGSTSLGRSAPSGLTFQHQHMRLLHPTPAVMDPNQQPALLHHNRASLRTSVLIKKTNTWWEFKSCSDQDTFMHNYRNMR